LVAVEAPDGARTTVQRDPLGRVVSLENPVSRSDVVRNAYGDVLVESQTFAGNTVRVRSTVDGHGLISRVESSEGHTLSFQRNAMGECSEVTLSDGTVLKRTFDLGSKEISRVLPSGGVLSSGYDVVGRLIRQQISSSAHGETGVDKP